MENCRSNGLFYEGKHYHWLSANLVDRDPRPSYAKDDSYLFFSGTGLPLPLATPALSLPFLRKQESSATARMDPQAFPLPQCKPNSLKYK